MMTNEPKRFPEKPILLIDDEELILNSYKITLESEGIDNLVSCSDSRMAIELVHRHQPEIILLDLLMPFVTGEELLPKITGEFPDIPVIVITANTTAETIVQCIKEGAFDYIEKPIEKERLVTTVRNVLNFRSLRRENVSLTNSFFSADLDKPSAFGEIITQDPKMLSIFKYIEAIAPSPNPVLVTGKTGTGKELIARAIFNVKSLPGSFVPVNVAGLDDNMFSDTLFGHCKGAFTGAVKDRKGLIDKAADGLLFLDEIGDLSPQSQIKLLRLIQEQEYQPLGSDQLSYSNAHIILATNRNLKKLTETGSFREDLYYRLFTHHIDLPRLKERLNDLEILVDHFLAKAAKAVGKNVPAYPKELLSLLNTYSFPGNIRELEAMITDAVSRHEKKILSLNTFKDYLEGVNKQRLHQNSSLLAEESESESLFFKGHLPLLKDVQGLLIQEALKRTNGNKALAASLLGSSRQALNWHLKKSE